jgi:hypothetical protein
MHPGRFDVAARAPRAEPVPATDISWKFESPLFYKAFTAGFLHSTFFSVSLAKTWRGVFGRAA